MHYLQETFQHTHTHTHTGDGWPKVEAVKWSTQDTVIHFKALQG